MKVALYGIGGLYNYGCEAIVRGTVNIIRENIPNAQITYFSRRAEEDKKKIKDLGINVIELNTEQSFFARVVNFFLRKTNIAYRFGVKEYKQVIEVSDVIFSIGGDIYTIPEYIRKQGKYTYYKKIIQFGEQVLNKGKILIIYGASIGPFGPFKKAQDYYFKHLKKVSLIVAREQKCIDYLAENGIKNNVCFIPDPAFAVTLEDNKNVKPQYIGINLSPLSVREIYGCVTEEIILKLAKQIEEIIRLTNIEVLLIPHVISPVNEADNDFVFMKRLYSVIDEKIKLKVKICKPDSFLEAKAQLRNCKIVIAARMHCGINAVSESIPTLFLSYSEKAKGMSKFVYGNDEYLLELNGDEAKVPNKVVQMLDDEEKIRNYLNERINEIRDSILQDTSLKKIIEVENNNE